MTRSLESVRPYSCNPSDDTFVWSRHTHYLLSLYILVCLSSQTPPSQVIILFSTKRDAWFPLDQSAFRESPKGVIWFIRSRVMKQHYTRNHSGSNFKNIFWIPNEGMRCSLLKKTHQVTSIIYKVPQQFRQHSKNVPVSNPHNNQNFLKPTIYSPPKTMSTAFIG